ncbi:MAG: hypothetical protein ACTSV2_18860 [Candidatus Thorarchaeota archaeon]
MGLKNRQNKLALSFLGIFLIVSCIGISLPADVSAQDEFTFALNRTFGTAIGNSITGVFTLRSSGIDSIIGFIVYFNNVSVYMVESNSIAWQFDTADYDGGDTNITLYAWDAENETYVAQRQMYFMGSGISDVIMFGVIGLIVVACLVKYGPMIVRRSKKRSETT